MREKKEKRARESNPIAWKGIPAGVKGTFIGLLAALKIRRSSRGQEMG